MKSFLPLYAIALTFSFPAMAQVNPVSNLTWDHYYVYPNNYFELTWDEPTEPHDDLIGYNIYRDGELYRFQTENSLYNLEQSSNCEEEFLLYNEGNGFEAYVTAVYNPGLVESGYSETVFVEGPMLQVNEFKKQKIVVYPNPSTGILTIVNTNFDKIHLYDISGKQIKELEAVSPIDLSDLSKGIYFLKMESGEGILVHKIILE